MELIHRIYASTAQPGFQESEIAALLEKARAHNTAHGLTGMLLYIKGSFFQVLEGEARYVDEVFDRIAADPRHTRVTLIIRESIEGRQFGDWTMGYQTVDPLTAGKLIGENDFFKSASCVTQIDSGRAQVLLKAFASGEWRLQRAGRPKVTRR